MIRYRFVPSILPTLATICLLPILIALGIWQLHRADYKIQLQTLYTTRQNSLPLRLEQLAAPSADTIYYSVRLTGHYDTAHSFLLDNKLYQHQRGYQVLTPFFPEHSQRAILINRGWVPQEKKMEEKVKMNDRLILSGTLYPSSENAFILGNNLVSDGHTWPLRIQKIDISLLSGLSGYPLYPVIVQLSPTSPGGFVRQWEPLQTKPGIHQSYAVQWFGLAIALLIIFIVVNLEKR